MSGQSPMISRLVFRWSLGILGIVCLVLAAYVVITLSAPWPVPEVSGSGVQRLTKGQVHDEYPRWSPDGTHIVFQRGIPFRPPGGVSPSTFDLYLLDLDDNIETQLTHTPEDAGAFHPTWSPDGGKIVYVQRDYLADLGTLFTVEINGANPTPLYVCAQECLYPTWSPDGTEILFLMLDEKGDEGKLYSIDLTHPAPAQRINLSGLDKMIAPRWSWDGSEIVTWVYFPSEIWLIPRSPKSAQRIDSLKGRDPVLSPDGKQLAYTTWGYGSQDGVYNYDTIQISNRDGTAAAPIRASSSNSDLGQPDWSPDGTQLVFRAGGENVSHIYLVELQGSDQ